MLSESILKDRTLILALSYAPAGFGHLRVAEALYHGLSDNVTPLLLGGQSSSITFLHRFVSVHPFFRSLMEWVQRGTAEKIFTFYYRRHLRATSSLVYKELIDITNQRVDEIKTLVIVATHFGLAHQIAAIKHKLEKERGIKVILIVQVTDDSPQLIWFVQGADLIFVPSEQTKEILQAYGKKIKAAEVRFIVAPYPVSPVLARPLSLNAYEERLRQVDPGAHPQIHVAIPLSGAAVGTNWVKTVISVLHRKHTEFCFHLVAKEAPFTTRFLHDMKEHSFVEIESSPHDREVIIAYEKLYLREILAFEITKPSEQAFKALLYPKQKGGVLLLFARPVGKQEYDNIDFLRRHHLLPSLEERATLLSRAETNTPLDDATAEKLRAHAHQWRGIELPDDPTEAANLILWAYKEGIFVQMAQHKKPIQIPPHHAHELTSNGVAIFWDHVVAYLKEELS